MRYSAWQLFHGPACHATPVHLCSETGDFPADTASDRQPLSHLDPTFFQWWPTWIHQIGVKYFK